MFEVYYPPPVDPKKEFTLVTRISELGGRFSFREVANGDAAGSICLTYEFDDQVKAEAAAAELRARGEHVEGPVEYGVTSDTSD
jgi:hypothetical protein